MKESKSGGGELITTESIAAARGVIGGVMSEFRCGQQSTTYWRNPTAAEETESYRKRFVNSDNSLDPSFRAPFILRCLSFGFKFPFVNDLIGP